jgi:hypothetical protein
MQHWLTNPEKQHFRKYTAEKRAAEFNLLLDKQITIPHLLVLTPWWSRTIYEELKKNRLRIDLAGIIGY